MFKTAIQKGVHFLIERQSLDGAWRDFSLEPGESDSWATAYVAGCLSQVPSVLAPLGWKKLSIGPCYGYEVRCG